MKDDSTGHTLYDADINTAKVDIFTATKVDGESLFPANNLDRKMGDNLAKSEALIDERPLRTEKTFELVINESDDFEMDTTGDETETDDSEVGTNDDEIETDDDGTETADVEIETDDEEKEIL